MGRKLFEKRLNLRFDKPVHRGLDPLAVSCKSEADSLARIVCAPIRALNLYPEATFFLRTEGRSWKHGIWFGLFRKLREREECWLPIFGLGVEINAVILRFEPRSRIKAACIPELITGEFSVQGGQLDLSEIIHHAVDDALHSTVQCVRHLVGHVTVQPRGGENR